MSSPSPYGRAVAALLFTALAALAAAGTSAQSPGAPTPRPVERNSDPIRDWVFSTYDVKGLGVGAIEQHRQIGGEVRVPHEFGKANFTFEQDNGETPGVAIGEVYSSRSGRSYSAYAEAPSGIPGSTESIVEGKAQLSQRQGYVKRAPDATMQVVISKGFLAAVDFNGRPGPAECPEMAYVELHDYDADFFIAHRCPTLKARFYFMTRAYREPFRDPSSNATPDPAPGSIFFAAWGEAVLQGWGSYWTFDAHPETWSLPALWTEANFTITGAEPETLYAGPPYLRGQTPLVSLKSPLILDIDLSSVAICPPEKDVEACDDIQFTLESYVSAQASNPRGRESGAAAYLRDPLNVRGQEIRMTGLEATNNPGPPPPRAHVDEPIACDGGADVNAGVLQFDAQSYEADEGPTNTTRILVTRTQGSIGTVSATFSSVNGTAEQGVDYDAPATTVYFGDGDTAARAVELTVLPDVLAEPDKTATLRLTDPGGCATIGAQSSAEVTILDDDRPVEAPGRYTVGGTVRGLVGAGLVLRDHHGLLLPITQNGPFTFSELSTPSGQRYEVAIDLQPIPRASPLCTVLNGTGTFTDHDITDVEVRCVAP